MGPSGCGKNRKGLHRLSKLQSSKMRRESTLAKLLLGFVQPKEGQSKIKPKAKLDGKDTRYLSAKELRNAFGVVPQETMLFSGTIYENEPRAASFSVS